jgi:hypothetical protein
MLGILICLVSMPLFSHLSQSFDCAHGIYAIDKEFCLQKKCFHRQDLLFVALVALFDFS